MGLIEDRIYERILAKKLRLDKHRPLPKDSVGRLRRQMEIEFIYHSNAIEGNTLTLRETQLVVQQGITVNGKSLRDHLEARNHPGAIEYVESLKDRGLAEEEVLRLHELLFSGVLENAGNYRSSQVFIEGSEHVPPPAFEVPGLMRDLLEWAKENPEELRPVELAAVFHFRLASIHPFDDGNGRVARLLMNLILIRYGYPFVVLKWYDRRRYYETLEKADKGDLKPFASFISRCVEQSLDLYLSAVEPTSGETRLLTLADAVKLSPYSQEYLSLLARRGLIAATKIGKNWHVTPEALDEYLKSRKRRRNKRSI